MSIFILNIDKENVSDKYENLFKNLNREHRFIISNMRKIFILKTNINS